MLELDPAADYDALSRKQPQRLGFMQLARAIPGYARAFAKSVPDNFYAQVSDGVVEVACPCGESPHCRLWAAPTACTCGRYFAYLGRDVRVARFSE